MKNQLNKILQISFIILFFGLSKSFAIEDVSDLTNAINDAREEFNNISEGSTEQSKIIDEAIKEIDKATEYVQNAIDSNNADDAIKTLEFIERSLTDVEKIIPQEFGSDMSNIDPTSFAEEDMKVITEITQQMNAAKEEKQNQFMSDLVDLNLKGIDTVSISENLDGLGIDTIELVLDVEGAEDLEKWTKEDWANSYKGSILTSAGSETVSDKEIDGKVIELEQKLDANNVAILDKRTSITELQTKIDPLSNQITDLKTQKTNLLAKYNEEILKQSSTILSDEEISQSKELADQFNNQLDDITKEIDIAEQQSKTFEQQIQGLNLELTNEIANKTQLENNIRDLNNQLSANRNILSAKASELNQLKNADLSENVNSLNNRLQSVSRERDFIETNFERSLDLEVEALQRYHSALGDTAEEIDFSMREVSVIMDDDPRRARAFELEKYATYAGFSKAQIQNGINAVNNDDWDAQKDFVKDITQKLSKNPNWQVDIPSNAELNVMMEEEKAIQAASLASVGISKISKAWSEKRYEEAKEYQPLAGLNTNWIKYAALQPNTAEAKMLNKEIDKILSSDNELEKLKVTLQEKQKQLSDIQEFQKLKTEEINNQIKPLRDQVSNYYAKVNDLNRELVGKMNEKTTYINSIGGYAALQRDRGNINYGEWVKNVSNFDEQISNINSEASNQMMEANKISSKIYKIQMDNATPNTEINNWINLQREVGNLASQKVMKEGQVLSQARSNLVAQVEEAKTKFNEILSRESPEVKAMKEKVSSILKKVPTFEKDAERLAGLDPATLRARLVDLTNGNKNESKALSAARDAVAKIGREPIGNLTGPTWEMTNVKAAAIVRSKKYEWVDDYAYIQAEYGDPLSLNSAQREEIEGELRNLLSKDNVKLQALNKKVTELSNELNLTKEQSQNLTAEISKLENELSSLKNSENAIQAQIDDLSNQFNSKESLIAEKTQNLASLQDQLNPISERMNALQGQRAELDTKLNEQLSTIANQVKNQGQASDEANKLKTQFENQIAQLDNQLKQYETQSVEINGQLTTLTTELSVLETENPEIANQIKSLNKDLENFVELKADLAMATAKKLGLNVNENTLKSVKVVEGKVVVSLEGTNLVSIVDREMLIEDASKFIDPTTELSINTKLYTAGALDKNLVTKEFVEAAKSISASAKVEVIAEATAIDAFGATTEQSAKYASAKAKRLAAREDWDAAMASGDKAAAKAAEAAFMSARDAEQAIGLEAAAAVGAASAAATSVASHASSVASDAASVASEAAAVASAAADAVDAVQESTEIASAAADAGRAAQQAALDALWELEQLPGSSGMHTAEVTAAIRQIQAEMNGNEYSYLGASSYEEAMQKIAEAEAAGKTHMDLVNEAGANADPNRMGPCGQPSC